MVLFVLSLLFLMFMVMITLSLATKTKEKIETQTVADLSAYSNAVATARAYNSIALLNRAQIGHMVALAGTQSLITWATLIRPALLAAVWSYGGAAGNQCPPWGGCSCPMWDNWIPLWDSYLQNIALVPDPVWVAEDRAAGLEALARRGAAETVHQVQKGVLNKLTRILTNQTFAQSPNSVVVRANGGSKWGNELFAPPAAAAVSLGGVKPGAICTGSGVTLCDDQLFNDHVISAAMGTRSPFVATRQTAAAYGALEARIVIMYAMAGIDPFRASTFATPSIGGLGFGGAYFGWLPGIPHGAPSWPFPSDSSDEHITLLTISPLFCRATGANFATVWLRSATPAGSFHLWTPNLPPLIEPGPPSIRHTVIFPVWPLFLDHNFYLATDQGRNFGQPKNLSLIQRDYAARPGGDPWDRMFGFPLFANTQLNLSTAQAGNASHPNLQTAYASGLAYYHRTDHWREPPNLMNPYWHATLINSDVDNSNILGGFKQDVPQTLGKVGRPDAALTFRDLSLAQFRGFH